MKTSFSRFTNTASTPIIIDLDGDDEIPAVNDMEMEQDTVSNSGHQSESETKNSGAKIVEVKPEVQDTLVTPTGLCLCFF